MSQLILVAAVVVACMTLPGTKAGIPLAGAGVGGHAGVPRPSAFAGAAWYGRDSGAGGYAGASLVSPLASSGYASPNGATGGNYLQGVSFSHQGTSAGFGGFGISSNTHLTGYGG